MPLATSRRPARSSPTARSAAARRYTIRYTDGSRERYRVTFKGRFLADGAAGTLRARMQTRKRASATTRATAGTQTWSAREPDVAFVTRCSAREEVAAWLGLSATAPAAPLPPPRREPPSREPPAPDDVVPRRGRPDRPLPGHQRRLRRVPPDHPRVADPQLADHPVVLVTRADALAFCAWLGGAAADRRGVGGRGARRRRAAVAVGPHVRRRPLQLRRGRLGLDGARPHPPGRRRAVRRRAARRQRLGVGVRRARGRLGRRARRLLPRHRSTACTPRARCPPTRRARPPPRAFASSFDERRSGWTGSS